MVITSLFSYKKDAYEKSPTLSVLMMHVVCDEMPEDKSLSGLYITTDMLDRYLNFIVTPKQYQLIKESYPDFVEKIFEDENYRIPRLKGQTDKSMNNIYKNILEYREYVELIAKLGQFPEFTLNTITSLNTINSFNSFN